MRQLLGSLSKFKSSGTDLEKELDQGTSVSLGPPGKMEILYTTEQLSNTDLSYDSDGFPRGYALCVVSGFYLYCSSKFCLKGTYSFIKTIHVDSFKKSDNAQRRRHNPAVSCASLPALVTFQAH